MNEYNQLNSILIVTASGGGGHMQVASAVREQLLNKEQKRTIYIYDILIDSFGKKLGSLFVRLWNRPQTLGKIATLELLQKTQIFSDVLFFLPYYYKISRFLIKHKIELIIDTQNTGTSSILKAMNKASQYLPHDIHYKKILTDLPTKYATHFFRPIKKLKDTSLFSLVTPTAPLLDKEHPTNPLFWRKLCNLKEDQVTTDRLLPLRQAFHNYQKKYEPSVFTLSYQWKSNFEKWLTQDVLHAQPLCHSITNGGISVRINPEAHLCVIMLGSNPHGRAIIEYTEAFIETQHSKKETTHLFVFCNTGKEGSLDLQQEIHKNIISKSNYPSNLFIYPLSYHEDTLIAPLFHRADITITKSGGVTSMELLSVCHGTLLIHSEEDKHGMLNWEKGNALYLKKEKGAKQVTPSTIKQVLLKNSALKIG